MLGGIPVNIAPAAGVGEGAVGDGGGATSAPGPDEDLVVLNMTVEEAFKSIMSSGIVLPADGGVAEGVDVQSVTMELDPVRLDYPEDPP